MKVHLWMDLTLLVLLISNGLSWASSQATTVLKDCGNCTCRQNSAFDIGENNSIDLDCAKKGFFGYPGFSSNRHVQAIDLSDNPLYMGRDPDEDSTKNWDICGVWPNLLTVSLARTGLRRLGSIFIGCAYLEDIDLSGNRLEEVKASDFPINLQNTLVNLTLETDHIDPGVFEEYYLMRKLNLTYHSETLDVDLLKDMTSLKELTLILSECKSLPGVPLNISSLETLSLKAYKVNSIKMSFFSELDDLKELSLDLPKIPLLTLPSFQNLETLKITHLKQLGMLPALPALTTLRMEKSTAPSARLDTFSTLKVLEITHCDVRVPPKSFPQLALLEKLNLSHNKMTTAGSFGELGSLKYLNLADNELKSATLILPQSLEMLVLRKNLIEVLETNFLDGLINLKGLDLSENAIKTVAVGAFAQLPKMIVIKLHQNQISNLDDNFFSGLPSLNRIHFSGNLFSEIPRAVRNSTVTSLFLKGNHIKDWNQEIICMMPNLQYLSLEYNPIQCDCLMNCLISKRVLVSGTCSAPGLFENALIQDMRKCNSTRADLIPPVEESASPPDQELEQEITHSLSITDELGNLSNTEKDKEGLDNVTGAANDTDNDTESLGQVEVDVAEMSLGPYNESDKFTGLTPNTHSRIHETGEDRYDPFPNHTTIHKVEPDDEVFSNKIPNVTLQLYRRNNYTAEKFEPLLSKHIGQPLLSKHIGQKEEGINSNIIGIFSIVIISLVSTVALAAVSFFIIKLKRGAYAPSAQQESMQQEGRGEIPLTETTTG